MTHLFDDAVRRLRSAWVVVVRSVAAGVFGLAIAVTVAVFVVGPETRDEWRALPSRVASGEVRIPVVGDLLGPGGLGQVTAEAVTVEDLADRAETAASRGSGPRTAGLAKRLNPFLVDGTQPFVASGVPAAPAAPAVVDPAVPAPAAPDAAAEAPSAEAAPEAAAPAAPAVPEPAAPAQPAAPAPQPAPAAPSPAAGMSAESAEVLRLVNVQRLQAGCAELRPDARLTAAAQLHSEDMSANNYMSHTSLDGRSAADRATAQGYTSFSGENVAKGYRSAAAVMDGWMNSPGHRANILSCSSVAIGVGVSGDAWTQVFGYA
ncbi:CAP domain-containing protein [Sanguibacter sp. 25GB23B1]|uniref:CAP domain-containing protein n=1 Tax=unclassified Sanguibacter TaxID=2645534 RepID=UPI0032AFC478